MSGSGAIDLVRLVDGVAAQAMPNAAALADAVANPTASGLGAYQYVYNGVTWDRLRTPNVFKSQATVAVGSETTVWTPAAGKKFRLMRLAIMSSATGTLTFKDNTAGTTIYTIAILLNTPIVHDLSNGILSALANNVLTCTSSVAANLTGTIMGTEE